MFLLVPAHPGSPGQRAVKQLLLCCCASACAFSALTLLVGRLEGHRAVKYGGWWRWALTSPDEVAPSRMVDVLIL